MQPFKTAPWAPSPGVHILVMAILSCWTRTGRSNSPLTNRIWWKWWAVPSKIRPQKTMASASLTHSCSFWWSKLPFCELPYRKIQVARNWALCPITHKEQTCQQPFVWAWRWVQPSRACLNYSPNWHLSGSLERYPQPKDQLSPWVPWNENVVILSQG